MVNGQLIYCGKCGSKVSGKPAVELVTRVDSEIEEAGDDSIDVCGKCWPKVKKFFNLK